MFNVLAYSLALCLVFFLLQYTVLIVGLDAAPLLTESASRIPGHVFTAHLHKHSNSVSAPLTVQITFFKFVNSCTSDNVALSSKHSLLLKDSTVNRFREFGKVLTINFSNFAASALIGLLFGHAGSPISVCWW